MSHANLTSEVYTSDAPLRKETPSSCKLLLTKPIATVEKWHREQPFLWQEAYYSAQIKFMWQ